MDLRYQLNQAQLKKEEAERELRELNAKTSRQMEKAAQVCLRSTPRYNSYLRMFGEFIIKHQHKKYLIFFNLK